MLNPHIENGLVLLRTRWPQTHAVPGEHGYFLIVVPGVILPRGYRETICTVLFVAPPGYPAACPDHFFTDNVSVNSILRFLTASLLWF
jgi:hypothetical protein